MIFKQTWVNVADNTNVKWLQVFHLYKGFNRRHTSIGMFLKGSARVVEPPRLEYKGFKVKFNRKGDICRGIVIRTNFRFKKYDNTVVRLPGNSVLLIKKKQDFKSKYLYGPTFFLVRRKRLIASFLYLI